MGYKIFTNSNDVLQFLPEFALFKPLKELEITGWWECNEKGNKERQNSIRVLY